MLLLNILQHSDGSFAWDNIFILSLAIVAGYLLHRYAAKKNEGKEYKAMMADWEGKYKRLEHEYKNYKSNIASAENHNEKHIVQMASRVKALEGDIRALSDEKSRIHHELLSKEDEIRKYMRQVAELEDRLKTFSDNKRKSELEWADQLKAAKEELARALVWEERVKSAEEEAQKAKSAVGNAERKKLEAELRLKATTEYAGKVGPLETALKELDEKHKSLEAVLGRTNAELAMQKNNNVILQNELEIKQSTQISLQSQIEELKIKLQRFNSGHEMQKTASIVPETGNITE